MAERRVPRIRFKGFEEDWEQRKFSELVLIERGGSPRPIDNYITDAPDGLNWVKIGDAPAQGRYIFKTAEKIRPQGLSKTRQVQPGDLILSNSMSFGKPYIMGIHGCIHDGWLLIRDIGAKFDLKFLCHLLGSNQMLKQYRMFASGSTVNNLNKELVGNTTVHIPLIQEQRVIGESLESIDKYISLHQRKLEKLKILKKAMLEKMFPKNGAKVPEIRFSGFADDWEQRKFADLVIRESIIADSRKERPSVEYEDVIAEEGRLNKDLQSKKTKKQGIVFFDTDILYGKLRPYLHNWLMPIFDGVAVGDWWVLRPIEVDRSFLYRIIQTHKFDEIANQSSGSKMPRADWKLVSETEFEISSNQVEQRMVGNCFMLLDSLLSLHQRKLEKLRQMKKSMLERMFV